MKQLSSNQGSTEGRFNKNETISLYDPSKRVWYNFVVIKGIFEVKVTPPPLSPDFSLRLILLMTLKYLRSFLQPSLTLKPLTYCEAFLSPIG